VRGPRDGLQHRRRHRQPALLGESGSDGIARRVHHMPHVDPDNGYWCSVPTLVLAANIVGQIARSQIAE